MALLTLLTAAATMAPPTQTLLMAVAAMTPVMAVAHRATRGNRNGARDHAALNDASRPSRDNHLRGTPLNGPLNDWPRHASELLLNLPEA